MNEPPCCCPCMGETEDGGHGFLIFSQEEIRPIGLFSPENGSRSTKVENKVERDGIAGEKGENLAACCLPSRGKRFQNFYSSSIFIGSEGS